MDIVLNTRFNNPNLPIAPIPGFFDDFTGGGGGYETLGNTVDNKPWEYMGGLGWFQRDDNTATGAGLVQDVNRSELAVVNSGASNGTLTAKIFNASIQDNRYGLAIRVRDNRNLIWIAQDSLGEQIRVYERVDNQNTVAALANETLSEGDTLEAAFYGPLIEVRLNGRTIITLNSTINQGATYHGFFNWSSLTSGIANPRWDWIRFE